MAAMKEEQGEQLYYQIKIKGELDPVWAEWFEGMTLMHDDDGNTVLSGCIIDQTALHSILTKVRDLNLKLISVNEIELRSDDLMEVQVLEDEE